MAAIYSLAGETSLLNREPRRESPPNGFPDTELTRPLKEGGVTWSPRRTAAFIFLASAVMWLVIALLVYFL